MEKCTYVVVNFYFYLKLMKRFTSIGVNINIWNSSGRYLYTNPELGYKGHVKFLEKNLQNID